ncbi:MAG: ABC transporter permease [Alphaproteobacteria bacterium]|jgi:ABC-2 type transport system permease protein|uniref:Transport permease protein n=1 Tax=Brevundimonas mediterranea TaxID=74329 RepID=A0A7Z8Y3C9_9CAUL|nr:MULTISPECIES: ABC transporter permease [Brevundimonas]MBU4196693.1 ABC transporter permease [Alphaproteobacteria bacterium]OGN46216.1 MAG: multidrug ABC transporter permease [Caulobacterales bacterium RIFCSPHIGHO2_01_FULL_67_30]MBU4239745.1 ABC transporter permease [Alphaproteobacteria bacterium]MCG2663503.1 ABC transporter permease [Brevundimonas sp.]VDC49930.1 Inner membrane transport permease YadH [Brevundimonas mediterranea]
MTETAPNLISTRPAGLPQPRRYPGVNWIGVQTLYLREVRRFWKVGAQTVAAPVVTTLLYMLVFVVALQGARPPLHGTPFALFVAPGLIMMAVLNNAFANASSSLIQAKIMGTATDFLTPPLSPLELTMGFTLGAATRGAVVGLVTALCVLPFAPLGVANIFAIVWFALAASFIMGMTGILAGLWSEKFDHLSAVQNFIVMPMTFLSGTFYLVDNLPEPFRSFSRYNPFFYLIDGFRYGFIGHAESNLTVGVIGSAVLMVVMGVVCWLVFRSGWRLKS